MLYLFYGVFPPGFHLSSTVHQPHTACQTKGIFNVAVMFDRGRITSCNCTCNQSATWCAHVVALCLFRIDHPEQVCLRAPVSEYLSRLKRNQLQKFAQYLINELPQQASVFVITVTTLREKIAFYEIVLTDISSIGPVS